MISKIQLAAAQPWSPVYASNAGNNSANDFDTNNRAFVPELWANESLMVLQDNLVATNLVHRDFEPYIAEYGDVINTRRPATMTAKRKVDGDSIVNQAAKATKVPVVLNQHLYDSFIIYDRELSTSFQNLVSTYLVPAIRGIAKAADDIVIAQKYQFAAQSVGKLRTSPTRETVIALNTLLDNQLVPNNPGDRRCLITSTTKGDLLGIEQFTDAHMIGDSGEAVRQGHLGTLFGTDFIHTSNNRTIATGNTVVTGAVNLSAGYAAGTTTLVVDGITGALTTGSWCTIAGDMTPQLITAHTETSTDTTGITISPGLKYAVVNDAVLTVYSPGAIDLSAGYSAGHAGLMTVDGFSVAAQEGQMVSFGSTKYAALGMGTDASGSAIARTTNLFLDRPLAADAANNAVIGVGPAGNYNWAFHRNAVAFVCRPLALPPPGMGVMSSVVNANGLSIRVVLGYDKTKQGLQVTVDMLCGVTTLDTNLGALLLG